MNTLSIVDIRNTQSGFVVDVKNGGVLPYSVPLSDFKKLPEAADALIEYAAHDPEHDAIADPLAALDFCGGRFNEPSPTQDDKIADFITGLTPEQREYAAQIIDGVSSRAWWDAQDEIPF